MNDSVNICGVAVLCEENVSFNLFLLIAAQFSCLFSQELEQVEVFLVVVSALD